MGSDRYGMTAGEKITHANYSKINLLLLIISSQNQLILYCNPFLIKGVDKNWINCGHSKTPKLVSNKK